MATEEKTRPNPTTGFREPRTGTTAINISKSSHKTQANVNSRLTLGCELTREVPAYRVLGASKPTTDDLDHQENLTLLDKLRLRYSPRHIAKKSSSKSRSLLSSPTNNPNIDIVPGFTYGTSPSTNSEILSGHYASPFHSSNTRDSIRSGSSTSGKSKKWYSFTNLLSKSSFKGILNIPRSRLSVSSIFTSENDAITPTEEIPDFGFLGSAYHHGRQGSVVPPSPSPSCVTVPGEFPASNGGNTGVVFRRPRFSQRSCSVSTPSPNVSNARCEGGGYDGLLESERTGASKARNPAYRISCGEFYPSAAPQGSSSPGFLGLDFQFHSYKGIHPIPGGVALGSATMKSADNGAQPKRPLGRSLPALFEAMESSKPGKSGDEVESTCGPLPARITVNTVAELLRREYVILTGSKSRDDHYLLIFPDRGNFNELDVDEYKMLVKYLTSIPPMQDGETGFIIIIDRRNDKWNSVKTALLRISNYFPGLIHRVFILRPSGFLQKTLSEISSKLFRNENIRFRLTVCNMVTDLESFIDQSQLTLELGGTLTYDRIRWVQERVEVESFHISLQTISNELKRFTDFFTEFEYPNDVDATENVIQTKTADFTHLINDLVKAGSYGEKLLNRIKNPPGLGEDDGLTSPKTTSSSLVNAILLQRFILQIEETSKVFCEFWDKKLLALERCLQLRRFEQEFRELQISFDLHVKALADIPEHGETVIETERIILETVNYQDMTKPDLIKAHQLEAIGRETVSQNPSAVDTIDPKCVELSRIVSHFRFILQEKLAKQKQWREVQGTLEKANELCTESVDMLNCQQILASTEENLDWGSQKVSIDELATKVQQQIDELVMLKCNLSSATSTQAKAIVKQTLRRMDEVQNMLIKRQGILIQELEQQKQFKLRRESETILDSFGKSSKSSSVGEDTSDGSCFSSIGRTSFSSIHSSDSQSVTNGKSSKKGDNGGEHVKRFHVLQELLQTEESYVKEIGMILSGYRDEAVNSEKPSLLPVQLTATVNKSTHELNPTTNVAVLFCNLDEIFAFHSKIFLPDLTACIDSVELVALCFIQRHSDFLAMYSQYCQLKGASDFLLKEIGENHPWLTLCRERLGHRLSLSSYLLKPVQRITKYHLLLGNLVKYSETCAGYTELLEALDCMVVVVRSVNDGMHQLQIRGYPSKLSSEGSLLLQGQFTVWMETSKNRLRLKGHQRYLFLYQKSILVCKKTGSQSALTYEFKKKINLSEVGITEEPKGSGNSKKFEIWVQGRMKVYLIQATSRAVKTTWVTEIKRLLMEQLQYLRESKGGQHQSCSDSIVVGGCSRNQMLVKANTLNGYRMASQIPSTSSHLPVRASSSYDQPDSRPKSRSAIDTDGEDDLWSSGMSSEDDESTSHAIPRTSSGRGKGRLLNKSGSSSSVGSSYYGGSNSTVGIDDNRTTSEN